MFISLTYRVGQLTIASTTMGVRTFKALLFVLKKRVETHLNLNHVYIDIDRDLLRSRGFGNARTKRHTLLMHADELLAHVGEVYIRIRSVKVTRADVLQSYAYDKRMLIGSFTS